MLAHPPALATVVAQELMVLLAPLVWLDLISLAPIKLTAHCVLLANINRIQDKLLVMLASQAFIAMQGQVSLKMKANEEA